LAAVQHRRRHPVVGEPDGERVEVEAEADGAVRHQLEYEKVLAKAQLPASSHSKGSSATASRSAYSSVPATWWPGITQDTRSSVSYGLDATNSIALPTRSSCPSGPFRISIGLARTSSCSLGFLTQGRRKMSSPPSPPTRIVAR